MDQGKDIPVSLKITKDGDFTFQGHCSEYEVTAMIEAWQKTNLAKRRHENAISTLVDLANWLGRFSGLFPLVFVFLLVGISFKQCQAPSTQQMHPTQQYGGWQYEN